MKISLREGEYPCTNCGREFPASQLDRRLWCNECRRVVVRRATLVGRIAGLVAALLLIWWIYTMVGSAPRFLAAYAIMVLAAYFFLYKLSQRMAFEIIRSRGVPPPKVDDDG